VLPAAEADLKQMDAVARQSVLRRLLWLGENATEVVHHRLTNLPDDLAGLSRLRVGDYRILYWVYPERQVLKVYRIQHRREVYRDL
jgi:mRNA interferase RelE/StbE